MSEGFSQIQVRKTLDLSSFNMDVFVLEFDIIVIMGWVCVDLTILTIMIFTFP